MAFCNENLSVLAYSKGFTLWLYRAMTDGGTVLSDSRFFNGAGDVIAGGDMIMVSARNGSQVLSVAVDEGGALTTLAL